MTGFDEREKGFERKFQQDQELAFKVKARGHRRLGLWAASRLGLAGDAADNYASDLTAIGLTRHGDDATIERILRDFADNGVALDAARVRLELEHCERAAKTELGAS